MIWSPSLSKEYGVNLNKNFLSLKSIQVLVEHLLYIQSMFASFGLGKVETNPKRQFSPQFIITLEKNNPM